ncbi:glycosyltransferase [Candidatus Finniella inopinata]|uniref:GT44 domain-containing protein n=1 Tax=Candidatus Finniella inopinata TaxID=1696036 RepID=A0A4Q7DIA7_9PROT|nr:glycosyltransferase [Candidatus Finniella inopinata]RZI45825.1 hypothetical protein EQU50_05160 [Candidatus Finniella inopinata]
MAKIWAFFLIALCLGINAADSSHSQFDFECDQTTSISKLLSGSSLKKVTLTNDLDSPVKLLVVSQLVIKTTPGIPHRINAPDGWNLITWNTLDEKCFPVVISQVKHLRLLNYAGTPAVVHAVQAITLGSKKTEILTTPEHYSFSHLANAPDEQGFINIDTLEEDLKLIIQPTCRSFWASSARDYDFLRCAFQGDVGWPFLTDFRDKILPQAGIAPTAFYQKISDCYIDYQQLIEHEKPTRNPKIPLTIHTIWLSDESKPVEPKSEYSDWLAETMQVCQPEQGWKYILWVNCPNMTVAKHPLAGMANRALADRLERFIEVKHVNSLPKNTQWFKIFESFMRQKNYGAASDTLRLIILKGTGGVYRDTDFKFTQSPWRLH